MDSFKRLRHLFSPPSPCGQPHEAVSLSSWRFGQWAALGKAVLLVVVTALGGVAAERLFKLAFCPSLYYTAGADCHEEYGALGFPW
jgi:hypothetical protein